MTTLGGEVLRGRGRAKGTSRSCRIALPDDFRAGDVLAFHKRDPLAVAERVDGNTLQKGLAWEGQPARLTVRFQSGHADARLDTDGRLMADAPDSLEQMVRRMLGLRQRVKEFEQTYRAHAQLGPLIAQHPGLRVPLSPSPFEALVWAITGQQISVRAALSLRRKLIQAAGLRHSSGLHCFPDARRIARLTEGDFRQAGYSRTKAQTLIRLSRGIREKQLPLDEWLATLPVQDIRENLLRVRGIGPWTVDYALLRGFGWLDGSLHGDAAVRRGLQSLLGDSEVVTAGRTKQWLAEFSPWRALVAAHLWARQAFDA